MADNTTLNVTSGGDTIASDDIGGVKFQRIKLVHGADGVNAGDVATANPLPVLQPDITASGTLLLLNDAVSATLNGDGSWAIDLSGFVGHVVTFESQVNSGTTWRAINGALQGVGTLASTATADGTYRGAAAALAGIRARLSTIGTGTVTANVRAGANSGGAFLMAPIPTGSNIIGKTGIDQTTPGTTNLVALTAETTKVIGTVNTMDADVVSTGTITVTDSVVAAPAGAGAFVSGTSTSGSYVFVAAPGGDSAWNVQITGLTSGTLYFEGSLDSTNGIDGQWINVNGRQTGVVNTVLAGNSTTNGMYRGNTSGIKYWRIRSVGALTGTPAIVIRLSGGIGAIFLNASIPAGANVIGKTGIDQTTPGTTNLVALTAETTKVIGTVNIAAAQTLATVTTVAAVTAITNALPTGANVIGALTANQSVNKAQINGVAPLMGNGVSGTGSQRVTVASDNTPFPVKIDQTTPGSTNQVTIQPSTLAVTVTAAANTAATLTLPAVAGQFHYITGIEIMRTATAALAGTATLVVTTTNLPGSLAWSFGNAMAAGGTQRDTTLAFDNPLKSSVVNTATTIVMPAPGAAVLWRANVYYYLAA